MPVRSGSGAAAKWEVGDYVTNKPKVTKTAPKKYTPMDLTYISTGDLRGRGGSGDAPITRTYGTPTTQKTAPRNPPPQTIPNYIGSDGARGTGGGVSNDITAQRSTGGTGGTSQYIAPDGTQSTRAANGFGFNETGAPVTGSIADYGYTPQGMASIYDNPTILANDVLQALGINNPGLAESISQYLDPAIAANFLLSGGMGSSSSDAASLSYANDYMKQMVTPNGATPEFADLLNALLGAGGADSPLGAYLNSSLTPEQQISAANGLLGQTLVGLNPYAQQAYSRYAKDQGNQYLGTVAKGDPGGSSYVDYLGNTDLRQWVNR